MWARAPRTPPRARLILKPNLSASDHHPPTISGRVTHDYTTNRLQVGAPIFAKDEAPVFRFFPVGAVGLLLTG